VWTFPKPRSENNFRRGGAHPAWRKKTFLDCQGWITQLKSTLLGSRAADAHWGKVEKLSAALTADPEISLHN
jgi:hypothetical protein